MPSTESITMGKELLEMAIEFQDLSKKLQSLSTRMNNEITLMASDEFYSGRNRENLDLANRAAIAHIENLNEFYGMCYMYVTYAYKSMTELDEALAMAIQRAYIGEHYGK